MASATALLVAACVVWSLACVGLYRLTRGARWLAAPTVATCLLMLGVAAVASLKVANTWLLAPLWLALLILCVVHLAAASRPTWSVRPKAAASAPSSLVSGEPNQRDFRSRKI